MQIIERTNEEIFLITTDEGSFTIAFGNNLDLYWKYKYPTNIYATDATKSFRITDENKMLYELLNELYDAVESCNIPFQSSKFKQQLQQSQQYNPDRLFKDGVIEWHSDDAPYEESSILKIEKVDDQFVITFIRSAEIGMRLSYSVCICTIGSRHEPFNNIFMGMFHKLKHEFNSNVAYQVKPN